MGLLSFSFASIHPGLKKAVDNGDVKTAENLVKRIGVHDVYCPKELSVENALIIYENIFSQSPEKMWDKCDPFFIKKAEGDVCKLSVPLCRYYLQNLLLDEEFEKLNTAFENIIQSKLYIQKEKRVIEQQDVVETSQKECLELLNGTYKRINDSIVNWFDIECKSIFSEQTCLKLYSTYGAISVDSINQIFAIETKQCEKKPTKKIKKDVEQEVYVNPFLYEITYYGLILSNRMMNPFYSNLTPLQMYRELNKVYMPANASLNFEFDEFEISRKNAVSCLLFPKRCIKHTNRERLTKNYGLNLNLNLSKLLLVNEISNSYVTFGVVSDSMVAFACKLYPEIDKVFYEIMDVSIFDCKSLDEYSVSCEKCARSDSNFIWKSSKGNEYICDNKKWRTPLHDEMTLGICSSEGNVKNGRYCSRKKGWIKNLDYGFFRDRRDGQFYRTKKIGEQTWMAENLNYKAKESFCYDDSKQNCIKYGRLYTWYSIVSENDNGCRENNDKCKGRVRGICPEGWHLPSNWEIGKLVRKEVYAMGGRYYEDDRKKIKNMKSKTEWMYDGGGSDAYGFGAYPAGGRFLEMGKVVFGGAGMWTKFWSVERKENYAKTMFISYDLIQSNSASLSNLNNAYSVRCVKD